jgi:hypothetical protein
MLAIGVDVSKLQLEWAAHPDALVRRAANDPRGIDQLVRHFVHLRPDRSVIESTGG